MPRTTPYKREGDFIIGPRISEILGSRLPTNQQVLNYFYHLRLTVGKSEQKAISEVYEAILKKWDTPTILRCSVIRKIHGLIKKYYNLSKSKLRSSKQDLENRDKFRTLMQQCFDISHHDAVSQVSDPDDILFLKDLKENKVSKALGPVDRVSFNKQERSSQRSERELKRKRQHEEQKDQMHSTVSSEVISDEDIGTDKEEDCDTDFIFTPPRKKQKINIMSPALCATMDRVKCSNRGGTRLLVDTSKAIDIDPNKVNCSVNSVRRARCKNRKLFHETDQADFSSDNPLFVHFDGKTINGVEVLPIVVTGIGTDKLIDVVELPKATGKNIACEVCDSLMTWGLDGNVIGCCYDTTSVNTGVNNGACAVLEKLLGKSLLACACRHHFRELELKAVGEAFIEKSSGPEVSVFNWFKDAWKTIDKSDIMPGFHPTHVSPDRAEETLDFAKAQLEQYLPRADYKELLDLTVIVLGGESNSTIKAPGATHHARWMAKAIYILKMYLFRHQLKMSDELASGITHVAHYIVLVYIKAWFTCQATARAPSNELELIRQYQAYAKVNFAISNIVLAKQMNHLWYLSESMICLSLFDSNLSNAVKRDIADAVLNTQKPQNNLKKANVNLSGELPPLSSFVTKGSISFFETISIIPAFLSKEPETWEYDPDYKAAAAIVNNIKIVNDTAERAVSLATSYQGLITRDRYQKKCLILGVSENRKSKPQISKKELSK